MDWHSRYVLAWRLSNTLEVDFCVAALEEALSKGRPQIFNTDQGSQFTSEAFTSMLRRKGVRVVSITEHADDSPTGKLMEAIIESVDEFYSENLAQEVTRGMREAASRGFFLGSKAPFGYKRVKVSDGAKERPTLKPDPATAPIVKEVFESSLMGNGLKEICKELNERGITNKGWRWHKTGLHYLLTNEAYTGTSVWGRTTKGDKEPDPVRVEGAWEALVSRDLFENVQQGLKERAPKVQRPARVGSKFLLSGLLLCGTCGKPYIGQGAKSGQYGYYVCGTLHRQGAGTCQASYLNAPKVEGFVIDKIKERILTDETITELVTIVAEEIDAMAGELDGRLGAVEAELGDVESRPGNSISGDRTTQESLRVADICGRPVWVAPGAGADGRIRPVAGRGGGVWPASSGRWSTGDGFPLRRDDSRLYLLYEGRAGSEGGPYRSDCSAPPGVHTRNLTPEEPPPSLPRSGVRRWPC